MSETYIVEFTAAQAEAVVKVSLHLCDELGPTKRGSILDAFSLAGVVVEQAIVSRDRQWKRCGTCKGSGWVEDA